MESTEKPKAVLKKDILGNLQNELPIHVKGKTDQSFTFREWGMEEEEKIAKMKKGKVTMGKFVSSILSLMIKTLHGENFAELEEKKRKLIINQMWTGNILYMYLYLRYDQVDDRIAMEFGCPSCGHEIDEFIASLKDLDVDCKQGEYEDAIPYKLRKPITLEKGQQMVDTVKLGMTRWDVVEKADASNGSLEHEGKLAALRSGIVGIEGTDGFVNIDDIVNKLRKIDIEYLNRELSKVNAGPTIQVEMKCDQCDKTAYRIIDWSYDSFFGISSLPES